MRYINFLSITLMLVAGCKESEVTQSDDTFNQIYQQFHGKYEIISSTSDRPVDIDVNSKTSTNLLQEIPNLESSHLELKIIEKSLTDTGSVFLFIQFWPEQVFPGSTSPDDMTVMASYPRQGATRRFILNENRDILLVQEPDSDAHSEEFPLPEEVTVNDEGQIQVVMSRRLLTSDGWQTIKITSTYSRYTMAT